MPLKDAVKISRKTFFNPTGWFGLRLLTAQFRISSAALKNVFVPAEPKRKETFAQAVVRLKLTPEDIQKSEQNYFIYAITFWVLGVLTILFSFYLLFSAGTFAGFILGLLSSTLFFVYGFRFHFWRFQIKQRRLGCTFDEWVKGTLSKNERPNQ